MPLALARLLSILGHPLPVLSLTLLAWSRLRLARHAPRDLVAGGCAGAFAGLLASPSVLPWQG